ncbi:MAG: thioredoxin domain-containing protein [Dehalococcoidia bacterium]|nr:MAG: thioredoxin domain-containing protein [Dehalococcoidia bacterium]
MANRLQYETSPYLLQHAHNPVDWYPWGEEAFRRAREENKPVLLSIGYAACHWCHVMERESFEDEATAALMNELFINIKVDREERPDVDQVYMTAVQALTGQGGWPLTVFLTPTGEPFYGGTYFPPEDRHGLPAFRRVLRAVAEAYHTRPGEIAAAAHQITAHLREAQQLNAPPEPLQHAILDQAIRAVLPTFDQVNGGFGGAPKFPQAMTLELLLRQAARTGEVSLRAMVELTLQRMAAGGIYDQLGGGFHRYAVDAAWQVPHFEKMLYDNALLARLYLAAWLFTGEASFRRVAEETLDYVLREMAAPGGGFCSSQDADSEGEEGKYYLWTLGEILDLLGPEDGRLFAAFYGVTAEGNFEGKNILHGTGTLEEVAARSGVTPEDLQAVLARGRQRLLAAREQRVKPGRDEKVLTSWNGMLLRALAEAAAALGREDYRTAAEETATFLLETLRPQGRLLRTFKDGRAHVLGYLEDYAHLIDGLLALYELTFAPCWLAEAEALADAMLDLFWDESLPGFYDTARDHEQLIVPPARRLRQCHPLGELDGGGCPLPPGSDARQTPLPAAGAHRAPLLCQHPPACSRGVRPAADRARLCPRRSPRDRDRGRPRCAGYSCPAGGRPRALPAKPCHRPPATRRAGHHSPPGGQDPARWPGHCLCLSGAMSARRQSATRWRWRSSLAAEAATVRSRGDVPRCSIPRSR